MRLLLVRRFAFLAMDLSLISKWYLLLRDNNVFSGLEELAEVCSEVFAVPLVSLAKSSAGDLEMGIAGDTGAVDEDADQTAVRRGYPSGVRRVGPDFNDGTEIPDTGLVLILDEGEFSD